MRLFAPGLLILAWTLPAWTQPEKAKVADGVYLVLRDSLKEADVLPLKDGEKLIVHRHVYSVDKEPPRHLVVRSAPDVDLALAQAPKVEKEGDEVVSIMLKLQPKGAAAFEKLTAASRGKYVAIVLGGEIATMHVIRDEIKGGNLQITSCAAGAAKHLLEQLQTHRK